MELIEAKISAMIALGLGTLLVGLLPALFSRQSRHHWPLLLSSLLCFGAGVLLSTSLFHMLHETRKSLPQYEEYVELIFCAGFFLVYFVDEIVHLLCGVEDGHQGAKPQETYHPSYRLRRRHSANGRQSYGAVETQPLLFQDVRMRQAAYNPSFLTHDSITDADDVPPSQLCHVGHQEPCSSSPVGVIGLLAALSLHALLEGLAVGLEKSTSQVLLMLGAIASHKLVVGFCLGVELSSSSRNTPCQHFVSIIVFSFGSVLGIGLGMIVVKMPEQISKLALPILQNSQDILAVYLNGTCSQHWKPQERLESTLNIQGASLGLAGGTLLYVTVCEVLPRERARWHREHRRKSAGIIQFISVAVGFAAMTGLTKYLDH